MPPWLSVVTVVKDDDDGLRRTLSSLCEQDLTDVEYLVVDSSRDPNAVPAQLAEAGETLATTYAHTVPAGIYAAMNAAIDLATGEFVYFLNAGDELAEPTTLARIRHALTGTTTAWAFGPVEIVESDGRMVVTPPWDYSAERAALFSRGHFPSHQGTVARRSALVGAGGFDTRFRIAGDYAMALRLSQVSDPVQLPFVLARFHEGGASTLRWVESFREFHRARVEILHPAGSAALRERWETARHFALVYAHRELRPRLSWRSRHLS